MRANIPENGATHAQSLFEFFGSDLIKVFDDGRVQALRGVDIAVSRGEFVAITGPSGCGKTTLLQLLGSLDFPTSGKLLYRGESIPDLPDVANYRARKIGIIFHFSSFSFTAHFYCTGKCAIADV